jgi:D-beta-D-heptose 7-phosphate kinase/D-beta-D-heptose 1-phosphate adenosyltransferase
MDDDYRACREHIGSLSGHTVLVIGDVMLDEYVQGYTRRVSPEAPVPIVEFHSRSFGPGGAANVSANIASLASTAVLAGVVGQDAAAEQLAAALGARGVAAQHLVTDLSRPTTTKTRIVSRAQQVLRLDHESRSPVSAGIEEALLHAVAQELPHAEACVVSDYAKGVVTPRLAQGVIRAAAALGRPVVVDPKQTDYGLFRGATVVKPNRHEVERFLGQEACGETDWLAAGQRLSALLAPTAVLITLGAAGMLLCGHGAEPARFPTVARSVFDVTGAGDTVATILALALAARVPLPQAVQLANLAAGIAVGKSGAAAVTVDELRQALI